MRSQLLQEIISELQGLNASSPSLLQQTATDKIFEIFVWSCTLKALRTIGATLQTRDATDRPTTSLQFRLGPGMIFAPTTTPGFVLVSYEGKEYELQNGLRVLGSSKVLHELDICILQRTAAVRCRQNRIHPEPSSVCFLAECKYYGGGLPLHLGREYLGLSSEFTLRVKTLVANTAKNDVQTLVKRHRGTTHFDILPTDQAKIDRFVGWLATELEHVL